MWEDKNSRPLGRSTSFGQFGTTSPIKARPGVVPAGDPKLTQKAFGSYDLPSARVYKKCPDSGKFSFAPHPGVSPIERSMEIPSYTKNAYGMCTPKTGFAFDAVTSPFSALNRDDRSGCRSASPLGARRRSTDGGISYSVGATPLATPVRLRRGSMPATTSAQPRSVGTLTPIRGMRSSQSVAMLPAAGAEPSSSAPLLRAGSASSLAPLPAVSTAVA